MLIVLNENLKHENIIAVFRAVVDEGCETRSEIAASTGLSTVTAGKAVEAFLDHDIFHQREKQTRAVGRHAGRIRPSPSRNFAVVDLSSRRFQVMFYNLSLGCVYSNEHEYLGDFSFSDNLCMFLHRIKAYMLSTSEIRYRAITLLVPGIYDQSRDAISCVSDAELEKIRVREFAKAMVGMPIDLVLDNITAATRHCAANCRQDFNILYINADNGIDARLIVKGRVLKRNAFCGAMPISERGIIEDICFIVACMCNVVGINEVVIESEELQKDGSAAEKITGKLIQRCRRQNEIPEIRVNYSEKFTRLGAALISRNYWLERVLR